MSSTVAIGIMIGLLLLVLSGCATATPEHPIDYYFGEGEQREVTIEVSRAPGQSPYTTRYKIVHMDCWKNEKGFYPWSCLYQGQWYWVKDGVGYRAAGKHD